MKILKETREFLVSAGEVLEFSTTTDMIATMLHTMPGWFVVRYDFDDETLETKVLVKKIHD